MIRFQFGSRKIANYPNSLTIQNQIYRHTDINVQNDSEPNIQTDKMLDESEPNMQTNINVQNDSEPNIQTDINVQNNSEPNIQTNINVQNDSETNIQTNRHKCSE